MYNILEEYESSRFYAHKSFVKVGKPLGAAPESDSKPSLPVWLYDGSGMEYTCRST